MPKPLYKRILVKLSGEFLGKPQTQYMGGQSKDKISSSLPAPTTTLRRKRQDSNALDLFISQIKDVKNLPLEIAVVIGAGNIIRGVNAQDMGIDRYTSDYMGMIGTLINALYLKDVLSKNGINSSIMSSLEVKNICPLFSKERALKLLSKGETLILAGGTGNPYFSTDTASALKAVELEADVLLKITKVDGVYDSDPMTNPKARKFDKLTYQQVIEKNLNVIDLTAISLCKENNMPIIVFDVQKPNSIKRILNGEKVGTIIRG